MKYYAVADDPRELYHYGVKGMKWGKHLFGDKPKSPGYKRALGKLRANAAKASSGIKAAGKAVQNTATQISYRNRARQERKYNKAVQEAQNRINLTNALSSLDQEDKFRKQVDRDRKMANLQQKQADIQAKNDLKSLRKAVKVEKHMPDYYQQAREGTLKYGKLSDEQIGRLQNRLALEANTRRLGTTEAPTWRQQKKMARRQGYLQGITKGTAAAMEEVARAGTQYGIQNLMNRKKLDAASEQRAKREKEANRIRNKKTKSEMREDFKQDVYESQIREGIGRTHRTNATVAQAAKHLREVEAQKLERQNRLDDARDERKFLMEEQHNIARNARQQRENEEKEERARELAGKMAYEYGTLLAPTGNNNGQKQKQKQKGGGQSSPYADNDVEQLSKWYKQRYIEGKTNQDLDNENKAREAAAESKKAREERLNKMAAEYYQNAINRAAEEARFESAANSARKANALAKELEKELKRQDKLDKKIRKEEEARRIAQMFEDAHSNPGKHERTNSGERRIPESTEYFLIPQERSPSKRRRRK